MKCPFCDVEMLHGYLNCGAAIWSQRKHKFSMLPDGKESYALHLQTPMLLSVFPSADLLHLLSP